MFHNNKTIVSVAKSQKHNGLARFAFKKNPFIFFHKFEFSLVHHIMM